MPKKLKKFNAYISYNRELIEPIDGFHMNQIANALIADEYWSILTSKYPNWLGTSNPNNGDIEKIFGNQGGY